MSTGDTMDDHQHVSSKQTVALSNSHILVHQLQPIDVHTILVVIAKMFHWPHNHLHHPKQLFDQMEPEMMSAN